MIKWNSHHQIFAQLLYQLNYQNASVLNIAKLYGISMGHELLRH